jgi:Rrf2 family protein
VRVELTKRADYAIRTVLALARTPTDERRSVRWLASDQRIPVRFLPQVMGDLLRAGLVEATVGRSGGYRLAKAAASIPLLDVIEAVEGDGGPRVCVLRGGPCAIEGVCDVHAVFASAQADVVRRFGATTVEESIRGH